MATLTKIGNSRGIRIPKPVIQQARLESREIEFEVVGNGLLLKPVTQRPREHWQKQINEVMAKYSDREDEGIVQELLDEDIDAEEWEW